MTGLIVNSEASAEVAERRVQRLGLMTVGAEPVQVVPDPMS